MSEKSAFFMKRLIRYFTQGLSPGDIAQTTDQKEASNSSKDGTNYGASAAFCRLISSIIRQ